MHHGAENLASPQRPAPGKTGPARPGAITRRIISSILLVVWTALLAAGATVYLLTRASLLDSLDEAILARVASLPEIERPDVIPYLEAGAGPNDAYADRYVIQYPDGRRGSSATTLPAAGEKSARPIVLSRAFTYADKVALRTLTVRAYARRSSPNAPLVPVTIVYSASADDIDRALRNLLVSLGGFALLMAIASPFAARAAARVALAPLHETSAAIGRIDERSLDRRINLDLLPAELLPVGARLNEMLARLEAAFAQRRQFLANASHELRTPVAALVTALEVALRKPRDNEEYVRILDQGLADAQLLNQLVVSLIEQARLDRLGDVPEYGPVALAQLMRRCLATLAAPAHKKGIQLDSDLHADAADATVFTDEGLLRSAILNLLSNALEYTPALGKVVLSVTLQETAAAIPASIRRVVPEGVEASPRVVVICVRDNGPGIKPEHLINVFEPFFRADASRTDSHHHLGLGLAAVRLNVRAMGGECTVQSPPPDGGTGCLFRIELPTAVAKAESHLPNLTSAAKETP